ncbi:MAG: 1-deoxy-D-xylulose-5-phosphate reductoisomerase [Bacteroidales bacterium]|nr:1-deoxy-D-xylulose-5-phosphate reductoisomerase [Bacteroidales bacterium]
MKKRIAVLGSTGSIGTQTLEVAAAHPDIFEVETITANNRVDELIAQAIRFQPNIVVIGNKMHYKRLKEALASYPVKVFAGDDAIVQAVTLPSVDMAVIALIGFSGLLPAVKAIEAGKAVALANKETLVVAGELITELVKKHQVPLLPVDSEHSAIFQCLQGESLSNVEKLILTASGGPFRTKLAHELNDVTKEDALQHPSWNMGAAITINSATMMNKGMEVIEACRLFGIPADRIEVVVHPQSVIHSMVQFIDGSVKAQMGIPDMMIPIRYALAYPQRLPAGHSRIDFATRFSLDFEKPDLKRFPLLEMAYRVLREGGNQPCVMNAANETAVAAFLEGRIHYTDIYRLIEKALATIPFIRYPTLDDLQETHRETIRKTLC